ncbi:MAG: hypothetical protein LQ350_004434 [Teloschistes chrysophthalmus]|nr:MAG: hypothetical protein LQ350_004434 [Niorma chrysophthalma]
MQRPLARESKISRISTYRTKTILHFRHGLKLERWDTTTDRLEPMIQELMHFDFRRTADDVLAAKESRVDFDQRLQDSHVRGSCRFTHCGKQALESIQEKSAYLHQVSGAERHGSDGIRIILPVPNEPVSAIVKDEGQELQAPSCKSTVRDLPLDDDDQAAAELHRLLSWARTEISHERGSRNGYKSVVAVAGTGDEASEHRRSGFMLVGELDDGREICRRSPLLRN